MSALRWSLCRQARSIWILPVSAALLLAGDLSWQNKPIPSWTEEDARQILADSPWSKEVKAIISRPQTEFERRDGGDMGQPKGLGFDGVESKKTGLPTTLFGKEVDTRPTQVIMCRLRWESALPIRLAELKTHVVEPPTLEATGYTLAVYGLPGSYFKGDPASLGAPLAREAVLKREGKKDVKPSSVEVFQREQGVVVVYVFPLSAEISKNDGRISFEARIGRLGIMQYFESAELLFQGKLEL
jgi:hypothetical protein